MQQDLESAMSMCRFRSYFIRCGIIILSRGCVYTNWPIQVQVNEI